MKISKSTRHAKITGDFGEALVLYWLSKYGFECARVDHTGIDIIARDPRNRERMGISVKSRCRTDRTKTESVSIANGEFRKVKAACTAFGCKPYFAIVVDAGNKIRGFIVSKARLLKMFPKGKTVCAWRMTERDLERYATDPQIRRLEFETQPTKW